MSYEEEKRKYYRKMLEDKSSEKPSKKNKDFKPISMKDILSKNLSPSKPLTIQDL